MSGSSCTTGAGRSRCRSESWGRARTLRLPDVIPRDAVHDAVAPLPVPEVRTPLDAFAGESRLLEDPLFGDVVGLGSGLDAVGCRHVEEVVDELSVSGGADAAIAVVREE